MKVSKSTHNALVPREKTVTPKQPNERLLKSKKFPSPVNNVKTYLRLAGIGFAICALIAYVFIGLSSVVPWQQQKFGVAGSYFSAGGAYLFALTAVIRDILTRKRVWSDTRVRDFGVPLIGASFGLFILGWIAIDGTKVLKI